MTLALDAQPSAVTALTVMEPRKNFASAHPSACFLWVFVILPFLCGAKQNGHGDQQHQREHEGREAEDTNPLITWPDPHGDAIRGLQENGRNAVAMFSRRGVAEERHHEA
eukprot:CAMPEP_0117499048 /NCGR_PEP_ID=MMETSP0784-20121206/22037_1 /TAXON_ID=39447 /ORGANISM="" /LENGTH=109 /DNA_ID=CAMNT_0005294169 /DNA_START=230 /DNA_END=560 /DNA_ORIENTATION=-